MIGIYKIENLINGKVYIGKSIDIQKRFKSHINESFDKNKPSYDHLIHKAIRKYGVENFSFNVIEECLEDDLNNKEIYWISFFDSCVLDGPDKGYNMTRGGEGKASINIDIMKELWDDGLSINEISKKLCCDRHAVSRRIKEYENFSYDENQIRKSRLLAQHHKRKINQYSLKGKFLCQYESILEAAEITGIGYRTICSNLRGDSRSAGGFQWTYENEPIPDQYQVNGNGYKVPIVQLDLEYSFVKEFESLKDAAQEIGLKSSSSLYYALKDINKTIKGFHWMYKNDYENT